MMPSKVTFKQAFVSFIICTMLALDIITYETNQALKTLLYDAVVGRDAATERLDALSHKWSLAIEFGVAPLTVEVVKHEASEAWSKTHKTISAKDAFRFVNSADDLAYLLLSIIKVESRGDAFAYNAQGHAYGLTQLQLPTARYYDKTVQPNALFDVQTNVSIATRHLIHLLGQCQGNPGLAVAAWNRGVSVCSAPENGYARQVFTAALVTPRGDSK